MNNTNNETVHVYALFDSRLWRLMCLSFPLIGLCWLGSGLVLFLPSLQTSPTDALAITLSGLVWLLLMSALYRAIGRTRYVVTEDGITYYGTGFCLYTPWKNLMGMAAVRPYPFTLLHARTFPGFKLHQNYRIDVRREEGRQQQIAVLETSWWNPVWSMAPYANRLPIFEVVVGRHWQERAFGRAIRQHAPWVFQDPPRQEISEM